jgi:hypothetical protein
MNPDDISTFVVLNNRVCKGLIDLYIVDPRMVFMGSVPESIPDLSRQHEAYLLPLGVVGDPVMEHTVNSVSI